MFKPVQVASAISAIQTNPMASFIGLAAMIAISAIPELSYIRKYRYTDEWIDALDVMKWDFYQSRMKTF